MRKVKALDPHKWVMSAVGKDEFSPGFLLPMCVDGELPGNASFLAGGTWSTDGKRLHPTSKPLGGATGQRLQIGQVMPQGDPHVRILLSQGDLGHLRVALAAGKTLGQTGAIFVVAKKSIRVMADDPSCRVGVSWDRPVTDGDLYAAGDHEIGLDVSYLVDALSAMGPGGAEMLMGLDPLYPIVVRSVQGDVPPWLAVIMPRKVR